MEHFNTNTIFNYSELKTCRDSAFTFYGKFIFTYLKKQFASGLNHLKMPVVLGSHIKDTISDTYYLKKKSPIHSWVTLEGHFGKDDF